MENKLKLNWTFLIFIIIFSVSKIFDLYTNIKQIITLIITNIDDKQNSYGHVSCFY